MTLICAPVPVEMLDNLWDRVVPHVSRAEPTARGRMDIGDLYNSVNQGRHLLWVVFDKEQSAVIAAFTTRIEQYPKLRAMIIEWMGGVRMKDWLGLAHDHIKAHAKENNCTRLEATGRNAWIRWAQRVGWEPEFVQYVMEV